MSDKVKQQVYRGQKPIDDRAGCQNVDIIRCRRNALAKSCWKWYVFSIWDDVKPRTEPVLGCYNFITKPAPKTASDMMKMSPHVGPGWRTEEVTAYMLNTGIINWDDISHLLNATCELDGDYMSDALDKIEGMWEELKEEYKDTIMFQGHDSKINKLAINSMIGLWANPEDSVYVTKINEPGWDDTLFEGKKLTRELTGFMLEEVIMQHKLISNESMVSMHRQVMDHESLMLARMQRDLRIRCGLQWRDIKECRVDSCLIQAPNKVEDKVIETIGKLTRE